MSARIRLSMTVLALAVGFAPSACDRTTMVESLDDQGGTGGQMAPIVPGGGAGGANLGGSDGVTLPLRTTGGAGGRSTGGVATGGVGGQTQPSNAQADCAQISTSPGVVNLCGHAFGVAYSPDGKLLAVGFGDANPSVRVWRLSDGMLLPDPAGQSFETTYDVAFSPDGTMLVAAGYRQQPTSSGSSQDNQSLVRVWDVASGVLLRTLQPKSGWYSDSVEFSPDGKLLLTAGFNESVEAWQVSDWSVWLTIPVPTTAHNAHFSPDGSRIVVARTDGEAWVYDIPPRARVIGPLEIASEMADAQFSPDGKQLATTWQSSVSGGDNSVRIYDAVDGELLQTLAGHDSYISQTVWIDQSRIVSGDWGGTVILWQRDASGMFALGKTWSTGGQSTGIAVSPDKTTLVTGGARFGGPASGFVFLAL